LLQRENPVVLIDGECALCNRLARFVIARDPAGLFLFAPLGGRRAAEVLAACGIEKEPRGTLVLVTGGQCLTRSAAVLRILAGLPFPYPLLAGALEKIPAPVRDTVYSFVASIRRVVFGRIASCSLLGEGERRRFLWD